MCRRIWAEVLLNLNPMSLRTRRFVEWKLYLPDLRHLEMIRNHLICSNFIFKLHITQMPAQHISLLGYRLLPFLWKLPDSQTEPFFSGVSVPLMDSLLQNFLVSVSRWKQCCGHSPTIHKLKITDDEYLTE